MKKRIIGLSILVLVIAAAAQRQNVKVVIDGAKYSSEEIIDKIAENRA